MTSERRFKRRATAKASTRRHFFSRIADGLHGAALASLLGADLARAARSERGAADLAVREPHFEPRAKSVIHLFMNGGPSQVDLLDPKEALRKFEGQPGPRDILNKIEFADEIGGFLPSPFEFAPRGNCGMEVSELLPQFAEIVDDVTLVRSMWGESFNHEPSLYLMHSGRILPGRPSLGSWVVYGLGTENQNLPGYVVLDDPKQLPVNGIQNWQSGWLPPVFQGTRVRGEDPPLLNLDPSEELSSPLVQAEQDLLRRLNRGHLDERPWQPALQARIASFELAARMQLEAPEALDISQESEATKEMYGLNREETASYGKRCLLARRLVERGVRFVQIFIEYQIWDAHSDLEKSLRYSCGKTDQPIAALVKDLKQRGLLDSTLVIWGGEFGRMPLGQIRRSGTAGRDHGPDGFSMWMAGGGVKRGHVHGATDEIGHRAVEGRVSVHDFHATMLHLLGMDYRNLTFERHGLEERLTDQYPSRVVTEILA